MNRVLWAIRWLLGYEGIPMMSRPTFRRELISIFFAAIGAGAMLPQLTQLFAAKSLAADWAVPYLVAEIAAGNFLATFFSSYLQRLPRIRAVTSARLGMAGVLVMVALLPAQSISVWPYIGILFAAAVLQAMAMTIQASVRHSNYSARVRGSVFSRMVIVRMAVIVVVTRLASAALDQWPLHAHHAMYPLAGLAMLASALTYRGIRVRGEKKMLRDGKRHPVRPLAGVRLLWQDKPFGCFMSWQMLSGATNLMLMPVIILWLTRDMGVTYTRGLFVTVIIPFGFQLLMLPLAGRLFDRMQITYYRGIGCALWTGGRILMYAAVLGQQWPLVYTAAAVQGMGFSLGALSWNIAHTRFAHPDKSQLYMGISLTMQGIRGVTMPFLGKFLFDHPAVGNHIFGIAVVTQIIATIGFFFSPKPSDEFGPMATSGQEASRAGGKIL